MASIITPDCTAPASRLEVRSVERLDDLRSGMITPGSLLSVQTTRGVSAVDVNLSVVSTPTSQGRYKSSWLVGWSQLDPQDRVWVDDVLPPRTQAVGAEDGWNWASTNPEPFPRHGRPPFAAGAGHPPALLLEWRRRGQKPRSRC